MEPFSIDQILQQTLLFWRDIQATLQAQVDQTASERVRLLAKTWLAQQQSLIETIERIYSRASQNALQQRMLLEQSIGHPALVPEPADSRALTAWLMTAVLHLAQVYDSLAVAKPKHEAAPIVQELASLFVAHNKRVAMEAHRFEDL